MRDHELNGLRVEDILEWHDWPQIFFRQEVYANTLWVTK